MTVKQAVTYAWLTIRDSRRFHLIKLFVKWTAYYSVLVITFGIIYFLLPDRSFYQSALESDSVNLDKLSRAKILLSLDLNSSNWGPFLAKTAKQHGAYITITPDCTVEVDLTFSRHHSYLDGILYLCSETDDKGASAGYPYPVRVFVTNIPDTVGIYPECPECLLTKGNTRFSVKVAGDTLYAIWGLRNLQNDAMPRDFDTFVKLLYFSGVTAATIGYGDIAPMGMLGRLLATSEAILSIVMLGLFINAVSRVQSRRTT